MDNGQRDRDRSRRGDRPSRFSDAKRDRSTDEGSKTDCTRLFISNIPYDCRWAELKDLFKEKVGDVAYVELFNDEQGKSRGCGVVEFTSPEATRKALEVMYRQEIHGRKLVLKEETGNERGRNFSAKTPRPRDDKDKDWGRNDNIPDGDRFNTYGLSAQFLDSINVQPPLVKKVFVANLDYKVDQPKIKEIFKLAGKVRNIDLSLDKDGKSRGFAVVEFDHPVEAVQAISMFDRQMLFDRRMTVRMDRAHTDKPLEMRLPEGLKSIGLGLGQNGEPLRDVARNLPQNQSQGNNMTMPNAMNTMGSGMLGAVPAAGVGLNGLGTGMAPTGLAANNALGSTALGLQALGLTGLGALQSQLLQQGLTGDLGNLATALSAQQQLGLTQAGGLVGGVGNLGGDLGSGRTGAMGAGMGNAGSFNSGPISGNMMNNSNNASGSGYGRTPNTGGGTGGPRGGMSAGNFGGRGDGPAPNNERSSSSDMVVVSNLPPTVTWQLLREKFSECGEVKFAEITSKDTAIVRFHKEWDAEMAVKMFDRTRIDGRTIEVRFF